MSTYKKIKSSLMNYGIDDAAVNVLIKELQKENITFSYENNILYTLDNYTNISTKLEIGQNGYVLNKINQLKEFCEMKTKDNMLLYYLYEKIKGLDDKIHDLENENENLREKIAKYCD